MSTPDYLKVSDSEVLSNSWGTLTRHRIEYRRRDGDWQEQVREVYDRGHGATCLLYDPERNCVLLTRQFRLPVWAAGRDPMLIEAPAGLLEGAHPEDRMRAELIEETGFEVSDLEHLFDAFSSPGSVTEYVAFFRGTYHLKDKVAEGGGKETEGEDIEVMHVPLDQALEMIRSGEIMDAKTIILLQELALRRLTG
ncbi:MULTISPECIES: NUDIX domain-containing protein [Stappiaceae]|uniref:GDP-mannose pyrophosphatase n=1 Tax=Roseibium aggregatum TaxID=187304 RepID=A0A0M6Y690_9HYPH|nr:MULTISPECIES: NUDIX domain-containing protein [Stappiaceae]MEC9402014.1 NUDIX domain-containing protein [Pseudomonadota bacterium]ERP98847.1 GDP-mannose pyrophosphatase nudK [Labrenzia sp. C1B10]ERS00884.1 GDP-mannose pyrophosphatase nudK [Labrenzia sp. C1B70]MBO6856837.1 NUDIX domain-containing protein [Roseibium sp.]MEC9420358.1 NUDIX domain-containing protein [Pseudomonadota bacterium]